MQRVLSPTQQTYKIHGKFGDGYFQQNQTARTIPEKYLRTAFIDYGQGVGRDGILVTAPKIPSHPAAY